MFGGDELCVGRVFLNEMAAMDINAFPPCLLVLLSRMWPSGSSVGLPRLFGKHI